MGQGREASKQFLRENAELAKEIRQKILAIKRYREQHGTSLQESLAAIEARLAALKS